MTNEQTKPAATTPVTSIPPKESGTPAPEVKKDVTPVVPEKSA